MKPFPIPVVPIGPGSQPEEDEALNVLEMPRDMDVFQRPSYDAIAGTGRAAEASEVLRELREAMLAAEFGRTPVRLDLLGRDPELVRAVNEALAEGEVSIAVSGPNAVRVQETAFAGVWRVVRVDEEGTLVEDAIEACAIPPRVIAAARAGAASSVPVPVAPPGVMNAPPLVAELLDVAPNTGDATPAHVMNLTLLPLSQGDLEYLAVTLGVGAVTMLSRGYGNCRISSTGLNDTWWVQYFNSMDKLILNTIEVVDVPEVALAAREDWDNTIERLGEWITLMAEEF